LTRECKFDHILTFSGKEGAGKSYLLSKMGMQWHSDSFGSLHNKEAVEQVQGVWLMEVGELFGFKKAEADQIKLFLSKREDRFRVAYGRRVEVFPRQCVFFGTTEEEMFLKSVNGNRRFWPVKIDPDLASKNVFTDLDPETVDQLWAEAVQAFKAGEKLYLSKELEAEAMQVREAFIETDERKGACLQVLGLRGPSELEYYEPL
jgi:putative DNA primase/helicase